MSIKALITAVTVSALATSALAQTTTQVVTQLPACGSQAKNSFGVHKEYPAINETNGYVGFKTEDADATGVKERYTLVNCATRGLVQVKAEYLLADSSQGLPRGSDMLSFVDAQHKAKKIANEALFAGIAKQNGYEVINGRLPAPYSKEAARAECGCRLYFPESESLWMK